MEMALGRQRVLVFQVLEKTERPVTKVDLEGLYARRELGRQLEQERADHQKLAWKSMSWWAGMY